jgi:hypothetical protein
MHDHMSLKLYYTPATLEVGGDILFYLCRSVRPKMFITFFSVIIYGSNLIFDHRLSEGSIKSRKPAALSMVKFGRSPIQ